MNTKIRPIMIYGNIAYVPLTMGKFAIIDAHNVHLVENHNWQCSTKGYAVRTERAHGSAIRQIKMHRLILNSPNDMHVDHVSGEKLDNRIANLRLCTRSQNMANSKHRKNNTSGFKGVSPRANGRWVAQIASGGVKMHIGVFDDPMSAHAAYADAAAKYHGKFARLK
jgi:HNH endonuclease